MLYDLCGPLKCSWLSSHYWFLSIGYRTWDGMLSLGLNIYFFLLLYACELVYLLSYEWMQQQSLDCHSFFRLIDGNCSQRSLHCMYPVGTVLLHSFNCLRSSSSWSGYHCFFEGVPTIRPSLLLPLLLLHWVVFRQINVLYVVTDFPVNKSPIWLVIWFLGWSSSRDHAVFILANWAEHEIISYYS
jgi:hypothetical protein